MSPNNIGSDFNVILVHQIFGKTDSSVLKSGFQISNNTHYIKLEYPGLSKSRNIGLANVKSKYAYIMDDDVIFDSNNIALLTSWMELNNVDVATCQYRFSSGDYPREYKNKPFQHNLLSAAKVASIEICVNVESLKKKNIKFDEAFGLGTNSPSGEEYILLSDCIKAGLKVFYYPITVGVHPEITSGMDFYSSPEKILAKRKMFIRVFGRKAFFFIFAFWLKKSFKVARSGYFFSFTKNLFF